MSDSPEQDVEQTSDDAESAAIRAHMEAYVPPELDKNGEVVLQDAVEKEKSAELKEAGSILATDPTETIILSAGGLNCELTTYSVVSQPEGPVDLAEHAGNGGYQHFSEDFLEDFGGKFTEMNGFIAYVPERKNAQYCLVAGTAENLAKIKEAGYESAGGSLGVISFEGSETLRPNIPDAHAEYITAQSELLKAINDCERLKRAIEEAKEGTEHAKKYIGTVEQATAAYEAQLGKVAELKNKAKQIVADQSWKGTTELAA